MNSSYRPSQTDFDVEEKTDEIHENGNYADHRIWSPTIPSTTIADSKLQDKFFGWFSRQFGHLPVVREIKLRPFEDGDEFNCFHSTELAGICFVRHARIHDSMLGWIESSSCARIDEDGYLEPSRFGGHDRVAIKVFELQKTFGTPLQENAYGELLLHSKVTLLRHKSICPLLGCFRTANRVIAVYPMYIGGDAFEHLSTLEARKERVDEPQIKSFLRGALEALAACHPAGICHRDVSLENFVLKNDNLREPVLIDFGVSSSMNVDNGAVVHSGPVGKAKYMAPELLNEVADMPIYDGRKADVFSLGVVLLILCVRMEPWDSTSASDMRFNRMIIKGDLEMVLQLWGADHVSKGLVTTMKQMMNPDSAQRPTVEELLRSDWLNSP